MSDYNRERDDFWDIEKLVPKKKSSIPSFASSVSTREVNLGGEEARESGERKLSFDRFKSEDLTEDRSYEPRDKGLIRRVNIKRYADKYDFYGSFRKAALLYYDYRSEKCDFCKFYSYMPQYSQLTSQQKSYYFYWRDEVRNCRYIKCDYSYLYLYVYEILNLPDKIAPDKGIVILCRLWREYRASLPRIDAYFSLWVQDYCLVHNLPCPMEHIRDFIFEVIGASELREFYLSDMESAGRYGIDAILAYLSDYDWRRGRYATSENAELYEKHLHTAMRVFLTSINALGTAENAKKEKITREAFAHSLCTHAVKCRLEIEYVPLARDADLRLAVTGAVRYTENKLRALLGAKSRLSVRDFSDEYKRIIDSYFDSLFKREEARRRVQSMPEYEKLYDAPSEGMTFDSADEIERLSWTNTARLVDGSEDEEDDEQSNSLALAEDDEKPVDCVEDIEEQSRDSYGLSRADIELISGALCGVRVEISAADRINEAFADGFGDVILEESDDGYTVIEDYREEVMEWLRKLTK